MVRAVDHAGY